MCRGAYPIFLFLSIISFQDYLSLHCDWLALVSRLEMIDFAFLMHIFAQ